MWRWLKNSWHELDREAERARSAQSAAAPDAALQAQAATEPPARQILLCAAVLLALAFGVGDRPFFEAELAPRLRSLAGPAAAGWFHAYGTLLSYGYWAVSVLFLYGLLPALHLTRLGQPLGTIGLRLPRGDRLPIRHVYLLFFVLLFPVLVLFSRTASFQQTYPFYSEAGRSLPELVCWELLYASTFLAIEFFFRGYLLFGLFHRLGSLAIFVSALPYCLIHIGKPASEMLGSIAAGILLGTLALRSGSIWGGVGLHAGVALSMDLLSLWQSGRLAHLLH